MAYEYARKMIQKYFPEEILIPQTMDLWAGPFALPEDIYAMYRELGPEKLSIPAYGNSIYIPGLSELWKYQMGYRYLEDEEDAILEGWDKNWLVLADQGADPFIYNLIDGSILYDEHGRGEWDPGVFSKNLEQAISIFVALGAAIVEAGENFTDDDSYILESAKKIAFDFVCEVVEPKTAYLIPEALGWGTMESFRPKPTRKLP